MKSSCRNLLVPKFKSRALAFQLTPFLIVLTVGLVAPSLAEPPSPAPLAHFTFNGHVKNSGKGKAEFNLLDTDFKDDSLVLNGIYEHGPVRGGSHAVCPTPEFEFKAFTVTLRFNASEFAPQKSTLLIGGASYRWFGLQRSANGNLTVMFNNNAFKHEVEDASLKAGKWTVVSCGVDLTAKRVIMYQDGKKVAEISLPEDFKLEVVGTPYEKTDKVWLFVNMSNGNLFHGQVDELMIHNRLLSGEEFEAEFKSIPHQRTAEEEPGPPDPQLELLTKLEREVFELTNAERAKVGLPRYRLNKVLIELAKGHATNMARQQILNHSLDGKSFFDRIKASNFDFFAAGENIQTGPSAAQAVSHWMESPGHKANILHREYRETGIGIGTSQSGETYWTQVFGAPVDRKSGKPEKE